MPKLTETDLMIFAQNLTKIALENGFIPSKINGAHAVSSDEKAKCVSEFYKTLLDTLNPEE